jgi:putative acetyltransferase
MLDPERQFTIRRATNADIEAAQKVVFPALEEHGLKPDPNGTDADLNNIEANYFQAGGWFEVVVDGEGQVVGSAGLRPYKNQNGQVELRKMYLKPSVRGRGLGRMLLERMLRKARELGFEEIWLETTSRFQDAIRLYESYGFVSVNRPIVSPRCDHVYMRRL